MRTFKDAEKLHNAAARRAATITLLQAKDQEKKSCPD
jgi:hypothetical protein